MIVVVEEAMEVKKIFIPCLILALAGVLPAQQAKKKRIAVIDFEYGTVHSGVAAIFGQNVDVGKGIADLLVERFVKDGEYSVIERKALDKILSEQNFSNSDRADSTTAAKIGRILGVDAMLMGSITEFGRDDRATNVGGRAIGGIGGRFGVGGVSRREAKAVVAITARLVDVNTAEILAVATGKGESKRSGTGLLGAGGSSSGAGGGVYDMTSANFAATIIGEATMEAVGEVAQQVNQQSGKLPTVTVTVEGLVADVDGNTLVLNVGSKAGLKSGDRLLIKRIARTVKDPATGRVIREITESVGEVKVTEVDEDSAVAAFSGAGTPKVGDKVETP
jgi:curli biogenesis system outer membrane secretion channel CsgG